MASPLHAHWDLIIQLRRKTMSYTDIAAELTKMGIPTTANNLAAFYKRKLKAIRKIQVELRVLDSDYGAKKEFKSDKKTDTQNEIVITGPDDPWKPKIIRPPKKQPEPEKPPKKWDGFTIGPDVIQ